MATNARIEDLRRRLEREPGSRLFAQLAEELRKAGALDEAIRVAREGLGKHPGYPSARLTLGRALFDLGDLRSARGELEAVVQSAPDNILATRLLAEALDGLGDQRAAAQHYKTLLALTPGDAAVAGRLAQLEGRARGVPPAPAAAYAPQESEWEAAGPAEPLEVAPIRLAEVESEEFELERPGDVFARAAPGGSAVPQVTAPMLPPPPPVGEFLRADAPAVGERVFELEPEPDQAVEREAPTLPFQRHPQMDWRAMQARAGVFEPEPAAEAGTGELPEWLESVSADALRQPAGPAAALQPAADQAVDAVEWIEDAPASPAPSEAGGPTAGARWPETEPPTLEPETADELPGAEEPVAGMPTERPAARLLASPTLAELYLEQGLPEQALAVYRSVLAADPGNERAARRVAELTATASPPADRRTALERTIRRLERLLAAVQEGRTSWPPSPTR